MLYRAAYTQLMARNAKMKCSSWINGSHQIRGRKKRDSLFFPFPPDAVSLGSAIVPLHLAINHIFFTEYRIFFLCHLSSGSGTGETQLLRWLRGRRGCVASKLFGSGRLLFFFLPFSFIMWHFFHCIITSFTFFVPSPFSLLSFFLFLLFSLACRTQRTYNSSLEQKWVFVDCLENTIGPFVAKYDYVSRKNCKKNRDDAYNSIRFHTTDYTSRFLFKSNPQKGQDGQQSKSCLTLITRWNRWRA